MDEENIRLTAALDYASRGFQVIPLHHVRPDGQCSCGRGEDCGHSAGKHPRIMAWQVNATTDQTTIRGWWKKWPEANVGVKLGSGSGVVGIDVDPPGGEELLSVLAAGDLPETLEMATGRGRRLLYAIPDGLDAEPETIILTDTNGEEAVRLQGGTSGAQCVMPPSRHPNGKTYTWASGKGPGEIVAAPMPLWLVNLMTPSPEPKWADAGRDTKGQMEGDSFNSRADWWEHVLSGTGAKPAGKRGDTEYVTRPGKKGGTSATIGHYKAKDGSPALYIFSGNWPELPAGKCFDKFGAYARLHHNGDYSAAGKAAAAAGLSGASKAGRKANWGERNRKPEGSTDSTLRGLATTRLDGIDPEPIRWLVPNVIPLGKLVMFAGDGGHGKTTLTLHMAACLSTGRPCFELDYEAAKPADILIVSCEDDFADTVVPRLLAADAALERVHKVDGVKSADGKPTPFSLSHCQKLAEELEDRPNVRLVIIDPAGAYVGASGVDDHKDSDLRSLLGPLAELAAFHRVTILLVKHLNKRVTAKAVHRVGGSTGYVNTVRAAFVVVPEMENDTRKLFLPLKFNIGKKPDGLAFKLTALTPEESDRILVRFPKLDDDDRTRLAAQLFRPAWDGVVTITADDAFGEPEKKNEKSSNKEECRDWMIEFMGQYAWPDQEMEEQAEKKGFGKVYRKTKALMHDDDEIQFKKRGFAGVWWNWLGNKKDRTPQNRPEPKTDDADAA